MNWAESQTIGGVSEVTLLTPIKPGLIDGQRQTYEQRLSRELTWVRQRVAEGIPTPISALPTIHYARWIILRPAQYLQGSGKEAMPEGSYRSWLLFTSNFDGDMKSYLRDFSVFLGDDVDRIWGNCEGWPPGGARDFENYWNYAKQHQIPTHAFYAAYPELSVSRIRQLDRFKRAFDEFVAATRRPDGRSIDDIASRFDEFLAQNAQYPSDFPRAGGTYSSGLPD